MTNEEIEKRVVEVLAKIEDVPADWILDSAVQTQIPVWADFARSLASQAYEEAAAAFDVEAGKWDEKGGGQPLGSTTALRFLTRAETYQDAARRARTLKDSLVQEPVASS